MCVSVSVCLCLCVSVSVCVCVCFVYQAQMNLGDGDVIGVKYTLKDPEDLDDFGPLESTEGTTALEASATA